MTPMVTWIDRWLPSTLPSASSGPRVREMAPEIAQSFVNFTIYRPSYVPTDVRMASATVRLEAPPGAEGDRGRRPPSWTAANTCSYLMTFEGGDRQFRVKQFLYDWAPPACDQPALWNNETRALPSVPPFVVWVGVDFQKRLGASSRLNRTMVELSVTEGGLSEVEIVALYTGLTAADPQRARVLEATAFAELTYWSRHDLAIVDVPYGLWQFRRNDPNERARWSTVRPASPPFPTPCPDRSLGFEFDSIGVFGSDERPELEVLFTAPPGRGREIRFIVQRGDAGRIVFPPVPSSHPGPRDVIASRLGEVHLRYIDERCGPWEAVFEHEGIRCLLLCSSALTHNRDWFVRLLNGLVFPG